VPNFRIKNPKMKAPKITKKCTLGQGTSLTQKIFKKPKNINVLQGDARKNVKNIGQTKSTLNFCLTKQFFGLLIRSFLTSGSLYGSAFLKICLSQQKSFLIFLIFNYPSFTMLKRRVSTNT
jgi:hypothetical protein